MHQTQIKKTNHRSHIISIVDYRNGKYQGQISSPDRMPNGLGIFLDSNYLLSLGLWKNGSIDGECLTISPNGNIFYGVLKHNWPVGMASSRLSNGKVIYAFINNQEQDLIFIDDTFCKLITVVKFPHKFFAYFLNKENRQHQNNDEVIKLKPDFKQFLRKNIGIAQSVSYKNEEQKWDFIEQQSKYIIKSQYKDYKAFLKFHFGNRKACQINLAQTRQQFQFGFKKTSILCHISQENKRQSFGKIKLIGFYDEEEKTMDIYRKIYYGVFKEIQEKCQQETFKYHIRPNKAKLHLINHYKKSTNFVNTMIKTSHYESINLFFETIVELSQNQLSQKIAQNLLQKATIPEEHSPPKGQNQEQSQRIRKQLMLQVKNEVYNRVKKRRSSNQSKNFELNYYKKQIKPLARQESKENIYFPASRKSLNYVQGSPMKNKKEYLIYADDIARNKRRQQKHLQSFNQNNTSPNNLKSKKYSYMPHGQNQQFDRSQPYNNRYSNNHLNHTRSMFQNESKFQQEHFKYARDKYNYQDRQYNKSINALAQDYQKINSILAHEKQASVRRKSLLRSPSHVPSNTNNKSPSKYNYLKSPTLSPTSTASRIKRQWR